MAVIVVLGAREGGIAALGVDWTFGAPGGSMPERRAIPAGNCDARSNGPRNPHGRGAVQRAAHGRTLGGAPVDKRPAIRH